MRSGGERNDPKEAMTNTLEASGISTTPPTTTTTPMTAESTRTPALTDHPTLREPSTRVILDDLQRLLHLQPNWDGYGAQRPAFDAIHVAWQIAGEMAKNRVPLPSVVPTRKGGVQLEWHTPTINLEWEIDPTPQTGVFIFDHLPTGARLDGELPADVEGLREALSMVAFE